MGGALFIKNKEPRALVTYSKNTLYTIVFEEKFGVKIGHYMYNFSDEDISDNMYTLKESYIFININKHLILNNNQPLSYVHMQNPSIVICTTLALYNHCHMYRNCRLVQFQG
jgi:hypothetical protein